MLPGSALEDAAYESPARRTSSAASPSLSHVLGTGTNLVDTAQIFYRHLDMVDVEQEHRAEAGGDQIAAERLRVLESMSYSFRFMATCRIRAMRATIITLMVSYMVVSRQVSCGCRQCGACSGRGWCCEGCECGVGAVNGQCKLSSGRGWGCEGFACGAAVAVNVRCKLSNGRGWCCEGFACRAGAINVWSKLFNMVMSILSVP